jgi:type IV fimbrial biogenesis protein FimT
MASLTVAVILLAAGIPGVSTLLANNQMVASTNDLVRHLQYARSESVKRQLPVTICSSGDGEICADSTEWGIGWIVFTDNDGVAGDIDGNDQLLRSYQPTGAYISIASAQKFVRYQADGSISQ